MKRSPRDCGSAVRPGSELPYALLKLSREDCCRKDAYSEMISDAFCVGGCVHVGVSMARSSTESIKVSFDRRGTGNEAGDWQLLFEADLRRSSLSQIWCTEG